MTTKTPHPLLLRIDETALLIGSSRSQVYALIHSGAIPAIRLGRSLRVPRMALENSIATAVVEAAGLLKARTVRRAPGSSGRS